MNLALKLIALSFLLNNNSNTHTVYRATDSPNMYVTTNMTFSYSCAQYNEYMNLRGYKRPCRSYEHTHGHVSAHSCVHIPITCTQTVTCMHTHYTQT